jgi:RND family efflux transporter MFP subunit
MSISYKSKLIFLFFAGLGLAFTSCKDEAPAVENINNEADHAFNGETEFSLSPEQESMAGITTGELGFAAMGSVIECTGRVEVPPSSLASVYSPTHGFVREVHYLPGSYVKKGALLVRLAHPDLIKSQREFLEINSQLNALEKDYQRKKDLINAQATSQKALDESEAAYQLANAKLKGLKSELRMMGINTNSLEEDREIQESVGIYAPVSGYVGSQSVNLGKLVSPSDLLYEIVDDSHMHMELNVFASDLPFIKEEQKIVAIVPGTEEKVPGTIHLIGKMIDPVTKTTMVHGHFEKEPIPFTPGTFLNAKIYTDKDSVAALPSSALLKEGESHAVFYKENGKYHKVLVQTGRSLDNMVEIKNPEKLLNKTLVLDGAYYLGGINEEAGHSH